MKMTAISMWRLRYRSLCNGNLAFCAVAITMLSYRPTSASMTDAQYYGIPTYSNLCVGCLISLLFIDYIYWLFVVTIIFYPVRILAIIGLCGVIPIHLYSITGTDDVLLLAGRYRWWPKYSVWPRWRYSSTYDIYNAILLWRHLLLCDDVSDGIVGINDDRPVFWPLWRIDHFYWLSSNRLFIYQCDNDTASAFEPSSQCIPPLSGDYYEETVLTRLYNK